VLRGAPSGEDRHPLPAHPAGPPVVVGAAGVLVDDVVVVDELEVVELLVELGGT
jgi:hypothetical protein